MTTFKSIMTETLDNKKRVTTCKEVNGKHSRTVKVYEDGKVVSTQCRYRVESIMDDSRDCITTLKSENFITGEIKEW